MGRDQRQRADSVNEDLLSLIAEQLKAFEYVLSTEARRINSNEASTMESSGIPAMLEEALEHLLLARRTIVKAANL
jgi:hypothetical protein